jgi:hypothetical protein
MPAKQSKKAVNRVETGSQQVEGSPAGRELGGVSRVESSQQVQEARQQSKREANR